MSQPDNTHPCQIFVYGTLKPGERAFDQFCKPYLVDLQTATTPGRLYHLPVGYPALTEEEGWVQGSLLTLASAEALTALDRFEDYDAHDPAGSQYQRLWRRIYSPSHEPLGMAWVYAMARRRVDACGGQWIPHGVWSEKQSPFPFCT